MNMDALQAVFNNREIASSIWIIIVSIIGLLTKSGRQFLKNVLPLFFIRKLVIFYIIFLSFFSLTVVYLNYVGFWELTLLKNTVFWVLFVQIPLFVKTITKAKDGRFFAKLIRDNLAFIVIIEFVLNYWTFNLAVEMIIIPSLCFFGVVYAVAARKEKTIIIKIILEKLFIVFVSIVVIYTIYNLIDHFQEFLSIETLKEFLLPILLLFMNLPVVYGLALYNTYEQVFVVVKGEIEERQKIKWRIFRYAGINLTKITTIRNNLLRTIIISETDQELKQNMAQFKCYLNMRIGDNYMKRSHFYIVSYLLVIIVSLVGIIACNSTVSLKDMLTFNFVLNIALVKQIITYVLSTGIGVSLCFLIYSIGFRKKKYEEISQIKKFVLNDLLFLIKLQKSMMLEFPPIENPQKLLSNYLHIAYEIKSECDKAIASYENLFANWELDALKQLQLYTRSFIFTIGIDGVNNYNSEEFADYYNGKKADSVQSEEINIFVSDVENAIEKYTQQINRCMELFKSCINSEDC